MVRTIKELMSISTTGTASSAARIYTSYKLPLYSFFSFIFPNISTFIHSTLSRRSRAEIKKERIFCTVVEKTYG